MSSRREGIETMASGKDFSAHLEAVANRSIHLDMRPAVVYVEGVKGCPFSCAMCHFKNTKHENMSPSLLEKIEPFYENLEVLAIHGQGEPLLGDLGYFVDHAVRNDFVLHMNTTGILLTERIADLLLQTRLSMRFSIHAGEEKTYRRIMGLDFEKLRRRISYLTGKSAALGRHNDFWFSFIVMKENIDEIDAFLRFAHDCGIRSVRFMRLLPNWQTLRGISLGDRDFNFSYSEQYNQAVEDKFFRNLEDYERLAEELEVHIEYGSMQSYTRKPHPIRESLNTLATTVTGKGIFPLFRNAGHCLAPWIGQLVINHNGDVRPCCSSTLTLGNVRESTLQEIWNSERMMALRRSFAEGYIPKSCGFCTGFGFSNYPHNAFAGVKR